MAIQIFGTNKNFDCKKAQMWFKERRISFQFIDLKEKNMNYDVYLVDNNNEIDVEKQKKLVEESFSQEKVDSDKN